MTELERQRFEARIIDSIAEVYPSAAPELTMPESREELRRQCERARGYGIVEEVDVARYVVTAWLLGIDFDERFPAMREVLTYEGGQPSKKVDAIEKICLTVLQQLQDGAD